MWTFYIRFTAVVQKSIEDFLLSLCFFFLRPTSFMRCIYCASASAVNCVTTRKDFLDFIFDFLAECEKKWCMFVYISDVAVKLMQYQILNKFYAVHIHIHSADTSDGSRKKFIFPENEPEIEWEFRIVNV